jgi:hypothetical protein
MTQAFEFALDKVGLDFKSYQVFYFQQFFSMLLPKINTVCGNLMFLVNLTTVLFNFITMVDNSTRIPGESNQGIWLN